jgi:hypothetical protein
MAFLFTQKLTLDDVEFDVSESESHRSSAKITDHPVEAGAQISDHVVPEQDSLELTARVTNTPIVSQDETATLSPFRAEEAYRRLIELKNARETVSVITSLREYENMIITSVGVSRNASSGNVLALSISLRQIRTATSEIVTLPIPTGNARVRGQPTTDQGKKPTDVAPEVVSQESRSLLLQFGQKNVAPISQLTGG